MLTDQEKKQLKNQWLSFAALFRCSPMTPSPPEVACVYAFDMSDDTVKIGVTTNVDKREKGVQSAVYLEVKRRHQTGYAPLDFMRQIEARCHATFVGRRERGEYFSITFEEAVAELDSHADEIAAALHKADEPDEYAPDCFFTYIVKLSNGKTRIGVASNFNEELERIMDETGLDIVDFHTTPFMSYLDAWHLKEHCKRLFLASDMTGEFYSADFPEVKAAILAENKFNKLLTIIDRLPDSEEKTRLVLQAASLI